MASLKNRKSLNFLPAFNPELPYSLYIHIPFCIRKCGYCAFYSEPLSSFRTVRSASFSVERYLNKLGYEMEKTLDYFRKQPDTVFIGGGNPGLMAPIQLSAILDRVKGAGEITVEMNPDSIIAYCGLPDFTEELKKVTRVSIGIQTMNRSLLGKLGRNVTREDNIDAVRMADELSSKTGVSLSFDLICCIPGQKPADLIDDIDTILFNSKHVPKHISLYALTPEKGTPLWKSLKAGKLEMPDEELQAEILTTGWQHLERLGYRHYEISNFALTKESECRHNNHYWNLDQYVGLGPAAASLGYRKGLPVHSKFVPSLCRYLDSDVFSAYSRENLDSTEFRDELLMVSLRKAEGINRREFLERTGFDIDEAARKTASRNRGIIYDGEVLRFTDEGMIISDKLITDLCAYT